MPKGAKALAINNFVAGCRDASPHNEWPFAQVGCSARFERGMLTAVAGWAGSGVRGAHVDEVGQPLLRQRNARHDARVHDQHAMAGDGQAEGHGPEAACMFRKLPQIYPE